MLKLSCEENLVIFVKLTLPIWKKSLFDNLFIYLLFSSQTTFIILWKTLSSTSDRICSCFKLVGPIPLSCIVSSRQVLIALMLLRNPKEIMWCLILQEFDMVRTILIYLDFFHTQIFSKVLWLKFESTWVSWQKEKKKPSNTTQRDNIFEYLSTQLIFYFENLGRKRERTRPKKKQISTLFFYYKSHFSL